METINAFQIPKQLMKTQMHHQNLNFETNIEPIIKSLLEMERKMETEMETEMKMEMEILKEAQFDQDSNFDLDAFLGSLERIQKIKQMSIEELTSLASELNEFRLPFPRTENEISDFEKLTDLWEETIEKIRELAQEIICLRENDQQPDEEKILAQKLSMVNNSLIEIDRLMTQFCAVSRYFPLNSQDSLLLIYDFLEEKKNASLRGIFFHEGKPALLNSSLFPKELVNVSSSEHFTNLLRNAHVRMNVDPKDLTKSTFSINQYCRGGSRDVEEIIQFLDRFSDIILKIHVVLSLAAQIFQKIGLNIAARPLKSILGGTFFGGGVTALAFGVPFALPLITMLVGAGLIFSSPSEQTIQRQNELYENTLELDYRVDEARSAAEKIRKRKEQIQKDRERRRRNQQEEEKEEDIIGQA